MTESYRRLYQQLRDSDCGCVLPGFHETEDVYGFVSEEYPDLCDDSIRCGDVCGTDTDQAEWKGGRDGRRRDGRGVSAHSPD